MKFEEKILTQCGTGAIITKYKPLIEDGELEGYLIYFDNEYVLELDKNNITKEDLDWMIKSKVYVRMDIMLSLWEGDLNKKCNSVAKNEMKGLVITDVKIVGMCSKCRSEGDEIPKNKFGEVYEDKDIECVGCALGYEKNTKSAENEVKGFVDGMVITGKKDSTREQIKQELDKDYDIDDAIIEEDKYMKSKKVVK